MFLVVILVTFKNMIPHIYLEFSVLTFCYFAIMPLNSRYLSIFCFFLLHGILPVVHQCFQLQNIHCFLKIIRGLLYCIISLVYSPHIFTIFSIAAFYILIVFIQMKQLFLVYIYCSVDRIKLIERDIWYNQKTDFEIFTLFQTNSYQHSPIIE